MSPRTWLITGCTSGMGAALVPYIVSRGDRVIATGRNTESRLTHLKSEGSVAILELDVAAPLGEIKVQMQKAWDIFGGIDVLFNNAGMSAMKSCEEAEYVTYHLSIPSLVSKLRLSKLLTRLNNSDEYISRMFAINLFGPMHVVSAFLPLLRAAPLPRPHPVVLAFTTSSSAYASPPLMSHYASSKAALVSYVEVLQKEVHSPVLLSQGLDISCVAFECGGFPTSLGQPRGHGEASLTSSSLTSVPAYADTLARVTDIFMSEGAACMPGDLTALPRVMVDIVKREGVASGKKWTIRIPLGSDAVASAEQKCQELLGIVSEWRPVCYSTDRKDAQTGGSKRLLKMGSILEDY